MYYPGKGALALMIYGDDWTPSLDDVTGRFAVWLQPDRHRALAANPVGQNRLPARIATDRIICNLGIGNSVCSETGLWFRLQREPVPQVNLCGLLADIDAAAAMQPGWALQQVRSLVGSRIRGKSRCLILALGYPGAKHTEWLFLKAELPVSWKNEKRWSRRTTEIGINSFAAAPAGREALMRRTGHTAKALAGKSVCIFGVGSVGSSAAMLLAKAGAERLRLVDHDTMRPGNAVRHVAGLQYAGLPKVQGVRLECLDHCPDCTIETSFASWDVGQLSRWIDAADIILDATASPAYSLLLNEICVSRDRPAVYVSAFRRATIGRIELVRPSKDACLVCRSAYYVKTAGYIIIPPGDEGGFTDDGCGVPAVEASAVDIEAAANVAARTVLHVLQDRAAEANDCLIVNEPLEAATDILGKPGHSWQEWKPVPSCATCGVRNKRQ